MTKKQIKIVAIDNQKDNLTTLKTIIWELIPEAEVYTAQSGNQGIELVKETDPDVILLDIFMPEMSGFEVCKILKSDPYYQLIPIIFLTSSKPNQETRIQAAEVGAESFMQKPVNEIDLNGQILAMVKIKASNLYKYHEKEYLEALVKDRTLSLEKELINRKNIEYEITQTKIHYQNLFKNAPIAYQSLDDKGCFLDVNDKWCEIFGVHKNDVIGRNFSSFLLPEYKNQFKERFEIFKRKGRIISEFLMIGSNNQILNIKFDGKIIINQESKQLSTMCALDNVTEIKNIQEAIKKSEEKYRGLVEQMPLGLAVFHIERGENNQDTSYRYLSVNNSYLNMLNMKNVDIIGKTMKEVIPELQEYWIEHYAQLRVYDGSIKFEAYIDTLKKHFSVVAYPASKDQVAVVVLDITERNELSRNLGLEKQRLSRVIDSNADIIFEIDKTKHFKSIYGKGLNKIGHTPSMYIGKTIFETFGEDGYIRDIAYDRALKGESVSYQWSLEVNNAMMYYDSNISPIYDQNEIIGAVGIARDVTEQRMIQDELEYLGTHDHLTGLYNRRYFEKQLTEMNQQKYYPLGIMMLDLNGLKIFNDAYGHAAGDRALISVANTLEQIADEQYIIARMGGDEFGILVTNTDYDQMYELKKQISKKVSEKNIDNIQISVAMGYDLVNDDTVDIISIQKNAENFMYRHKVVEGMSIRNSAIQAILKTLTDKYTEEKIHSQHVSELCVELGREYKLDEEHLKELKYAGMYHDIGKISIPDAILYKPAKLTDEEFVVMKTHTEVGYSILKAADEYSDLAEHALYHHERWDGKGYPRGLSEFEIPLFSRIINICDSFEAMTADRPYKKKMTIDEATQEIIRCSGFQFDPMLAKLFVTNVLKKSWS